MFTNKLRQITPRPPAFQTLTQSGTESNVALKGTTRQGRTRAIRFSINSVGGYKIYVSCLGPN